MLHHLTYHGQHKYLSICILQFFLEATTLILLGGENDEFESNQKKILIYIHVLGYNSTYKKKKCFGLKHPLINYHISVTQYDPIKFEISNLTTNIEFLFFSFF